MSFFKLVDTALEKTILFSYSNIGIRLRKHLWESDYEEADLSGKVCVVTGANSGIGYATSYALAERGATVILVCRNERRGSDALLKLKSDTGNDDIHLELCDLSDLDHVRDLAQRLQTQYSAIDRLVHNAGVMVHERTESPQGHEVNLATNVLAPFLLTRLLETQLKSSTDARVIWVSSGGMYSQRLDAEDIHHANMAPFDGMRVYAQNKRAQVIISEQFAERFADTNVRSDAMHPGWAETPAVKTAMPRFHQVMQPLLRSWQEGADTVIWLATVKSLPEPSGSFWHDRRPRPTHLMARTREDEADRLLLWDRCEELTGLDQG